MSREPLPASVEAWIIGSVKGDARTGVVACTAGDLAASRARGYPTVAFHEVAAGRDIPRASAVRVVVPAYRGKSLVRFLAWFVQARLASASAEATWVVDRSAGAKSIARLLGELGWTIELRRSGRAAELTGSVPPVTGPMPTIANFEADLVGQRAVLAADFGVFSPRGVDPGSALLLAAALEHPVVDTVADIGIGYGVLGIGMARHGRCRHVVATDVDSIALWLAGRNAERNGVALDAECSADPCAVPSTALTLSNVPTHINAADTAALLDGLARRAIGGTVMIVVHASLEARYERHLRRSSLRIDVHRGASHVVLTATARR